MANYVVKEMPEGMKSSKGKVFPKMPVYSEFDNDKVVELINTYSPALEFIDKHGSIRLQEYANLNSLSRTQASRELAKFVSDPTSGIKTSGSGPLKCWVRG